MEILNFKATSGIYFCKIILWLIALLIMSSCKEKEQEYFYLPDKTADLYVKICNETGKDQKVSITMLNAQGAAILFYDTAEVDSCKIIYAELPKSELTEIKYINLDKNISDSCSITTDKENVVLNIRMDKRKFYIVYSDTLEINVN